MAKTFLSVKLKILLQKQLNSDFNLHNMHALYQYEANIPNTFWALYCFVM